MSNQIKNRIREAVMNNKLKEINDLVVNNNFDLKSPIDFNDLTILHFSVLLSKYEIVEYLCGQLNNVNLFDKLHRTPLHYAATQQDLGLLKILLKSGADVNIQSIGGETPLMKAVSFNKIEAARLLMRFGSDLSILNYVRLLFNLEDNQTARDIASNTKNVSMVNLIDEYEKIASKI